MSDTLSNNGSSNGSSAYTPEVSVIVNCYNESRYLGECLDSVFAQTFQDWEIIFWDNASDDNSSEIAANYGERVHCFRGDTLVPLGRARNLAYEQTQGKYIAILDADDVWLPDKLQRQVELFRSNPELGMAYCDTTVFDETGDLYRQFQLHNPHRGNAFGPLLTRVSITPSAILMRREAVEQLACIFDERYGRAQDVDLCLRLAYSYPIDYVEEPLCRWRQIKNVQKPWKSGLVPRTVDIKSMMNNLLEDFPDIPQKYPAELQIANQRLDYFFGVTEWENGNSAEARRYLSPHLNSKKIALVYFATYFLPFGWFAKASEAYRNRVAKRS